MSDCISDDKLVEYWSGDIVGDECDALEEHLFTCDKCSAANVELAGLVEALRETIPFVISHGQRDRMRARGARVYVTDVVPDVHSSIRFTPEVDLHVFALRADLRRAERVDVTIFSPTGEVGAVYEHVPFDVSSGEILIACQRHYEGMFPGDPVFRVEVTEAGSRRDLKYVVEHNWR